MNDQNTIALFNKAAEQYRISGLRTDEEAMIRRCFPPAPAQILVVGCGAGRTIFPLADLGYMVHGVDIAPNMIRIAKEEAAQKQSTATFDVGDAASIGEEFPNKSFDVIWFPWHSLDYVSPEHVREHTLIGASHILRQNGICVFTTHNRLFPRILKQFIKAHSNAYTTLFSSEGGLHTYTSLPWSAGAQARAHFAFVNTFARYAFIKPSHPKLKEIFARLTSPLLDKSFYVICREPIQNPILARSFETQPTIRSRAV